VGHAGGAQTPAEFIRLGRAESLRLLATAPVGRLIFAVNALPAVRLMNFALADGLIVLRTAADTTVARKINEGHSAIRAPPRRQDARALGHLAPYQRIPRHCY